MKKALKHYVAMACFVAMIILLGSSTIYFLVERHQPMTAAIIFALGLPAVLIIAHALIDWAEKITDLTTTTKGKR